MVVRRVGPLAQEIIRSRDEDSTDSAIGHWLKPWREVSDSEARVKNASYEDDDRGDMQPAHADVQEGVHTPSITVHGFCFL